MSDNTYVELDAVQLRNCEVVISKHKRGSKMLLSIAPRKSFTDPESGELRLFIPKRSAIEFETITELDDLLTALIDVRKEGILQPA